MRAPARLSGPRSKNTPRGQVGAFLRRRRHSPKMAMYGFRDHARTAPPTTPPPRVRVGTMSGVGKTPRAPPRDASGPRWPFPNLFFHLFRRGTTLRAHPGWKSRFWRAPRVLDSLGNLQRAREKKNQLRPRPGARAMIKWVKPTWSNFFFLDL